MPEPLLYLQGMLAAAIVSAITVLAMVAVRRHVSVAWLNAASVLGISLGLIAGYRVVAIRWTWPPLNGLDRFLTIIVPLTVGIELLAGFSSVPRRVVWLLRLASAATLSRILLHGSVYLGGSADGWTSSQEAAVVIGCGALLAGAWSLLASLSQRSPGISIPLALCLPILCTGMTVMMAGYIKGGVAAIPLVATLVATTLMTKLASKRCTVPTNSNTLAIIGVGVVGLFGLLFLGRFFGRLPTSYALAMFLSPLMCWVAEVPQLRARNPRQLGVLRLVVVAIPVVVVLIAAKRDFDRNMAPLLGSMQAAGSSDAMPAD